MNQRMVAIRDRIGVVSVVLLSACKGGIGPAPESAFTVPRSQESSVLGAVGKPLPLQGLRDANGSPSTGSPVGMAGSLIFVVDAADCMSCLGIQAEAWEAFRSAGDHKLGFVTVFEGRDTTAVHRFLIDHRMPGTSLLDPDGRVMRTLGPHPHPLVIWLGPSGRVVAMIPRTMGAPPEAVRQLLSDARAGGVAAPESGS